MPKLVYFPLQGRAQAIRFLLRSKGVAFEDELLTFEEWGSVKAAATYGEGTQLPVWVCDDGTVLNQSIAILKMLAEENGYAPENPKQRYENEWFYATIVDILEKPERMAIMKDDATEEQKQAAIDVFTRFLDKLNTHWADGRAHVAGDKVTDADFTLLNLVTGQLDNAGSKHAAIREATAAKLQSSENVLRVVAPMRELCADQIAALAPCPI